MDNLRRSIKLLFSDYCCDYILANCEHDYVNATKFMEFGFSKFENYSLNEIENVYSKLDNDWFFDVINQKNKSLFQILNHFNCKVLTEDNLEPFVVYEHLLKWRDLSYQLGEDIFTTSYFAYLDNKSQRKRDFFSWRTTAFSNNKRLSAIVGRGMAENHFHLKGSGPVSDLSWINLMNHPVDYENEFKDLETEMVLLTKSSNSSKSSEKHLKVLVYKAAYIRYKLFCMINNINSNGYDNDLVIDITQESNSRDSFDLMMNMGGISKSIELVRFDVGHRFIYKGDGSCVIDYAIPRNIHIENHKKSYIFYGERKLMYDCFQLIFSNAKSFKNSVALFHSYLLIKSQFRAELIQVNDKVGFGNFSRYQDRKEYFLPDGSIYHTAFMNLAVHNTKKHSVIHSFELRIAPKDNVFKLNSSLKGYIKALDISAIQTKQLTVVDPLPYDLSKDNIFFTIHYIKVKEVELSDNIVNEVLCRHHALRKDVKMQSIAITQLRESCSELSNHIKGIDAASNEFDANPEVFAQGFRYLKNHKLTGRFNHLKDDLQEHRFYATYHAGEDFYDVIDGLRSIDECIHFLNLKQGDRLGHALALGVNCFEHYTFKRNKLMLPKQVLLDNIVWLLAKVRKFGITIHHNEINRLEKLYENLFNEVFSRNFDQGNLLYNKYIHHTTYYNSWKLRGDDPYLYIDNLNEDIHSKINLTYWERCRINEEYPINKSSRNNLDVKTLYQQYHFNNAIKKDGKKIKQFEISFEYRELVYEVQLKMQQYVKNRSIYIETNPTSNYLIGTFKRYSKHPITTFFNLGLELNNEIVKNCPQLSVSINTDDQGIFSTSLENEYALMAIALEKEKDEHGKPKYNSSMIYDWLERVRLMGLGQSFSQ